ncbi:hypothetical protein, partial [Noviherbaspirillum denitrificans]|uniref:hypothetical protein n=1 Tax=Noviherbaspirillum denitrificans TaxID=1968433 RepID=UPI00197DA664
GYGSPNTVLLQLIEPVAVRVAHLSPKPYRTCFVPVNAHVPYSLAQRVHDVVVVVVVVVVVDGAGAGAGAGAVVSTWHTLFAPG